MKTFAFGIDGLDKKFLNKYKNELPNFSNMLDTSPDTTLNSVHPPDSHTAWASIYTGLNPAQHGIVDFVDPLEKNKILAEGDIDNSVIKGMTFWDVLSKKGKKVCVVFPHLGYPAWGVEGVMVGRSSFKDDISIYPAHFKDKYDFSDLNVLKGFPQKNQLDDYISQAKKLIHAECKFTIQLMKDNEWDLTYTYSSALDWIEHYFWNYFEEGYDEKYKNVILDFYKEYDSIVGLYMNELDATTSRLMIFSDHGHGMRPKKVVNINEVLRQKGYLKSKIKTNNISSPLYLFEKIKKHAVINIVKYNLGNTAQKIMKIVPQCRDVYTSPVSINWKDTIAYISDLSGIKAYSYGGIKIARDNLNGLDYEQLRQKIISDMLKLKDPNTNELLFKWIKKSEDLYTGEFIDKYPDLIFDLNEGYGAGWQTHEDLIVDAPASSLVPGSHKIDTAVFLCLSSNEKYIRDNLTLMDIGLIILDDF